MTAFHPYVDPARREQLRLEALGELDLLDTPSEREFDVIVELANRLLGFPITAVTLIDETRHWVKAGLGVPSGLESPREDAFCNHAIRDDAMMVVEDTSADPRFTDNPFVTGDMHIRFYAGVPLRLAAADAEPTDIDAIGTLCVLDTRPRTLSDDDRRVLQMLADLTDTLIRARASTAKARQAANLLRRKNWQLGQAERMAAIGSWRYDVATTTVEWSEEVYAIHGLPPGNDPPLEQALDFYPSEDRERIAAMLERAIAHGEGYEFESDMVTATGALKRVRVKAEVEKVDGALVSVIGVFQDITERHAYEKVLRQSANTDSLTGLPNRRMFEERLGEVGLQAARTGEPYAILIVDLDGFKPVNDTLGHEAGDEVLREMAVKLRGKAFAQSFAARLGGDEFVMLVTRPRDCADLPGFVQAVLRELRVVAERNDARLGVTSTVGAALAEGGVGAGLDILKQADLALYAAKRAQRGTGRVFGASDVIHPWSVLKPPPLRSIG